MGEVTLTSRDSLTWGWHPYVCSQVYFRFIIWIKQEAVTKEFRSTLQRVTLWVALTYFSSLPLDILTESIDKFFKQWDRLEPRGKVAIAEVVKLQRLAVTRYVAGEAIKLKGIKQDRAHLPLVLPRGLRDLILVRDPWAIRWSISLLSTTRSLLGGKDVDFSSIVTPSSGDHSKISDYEILTFYKKIGRPKLKYEWDEYHWSTKAGPNGPSLQGALADLVKLQGTRIIDALKVFYPAEAPIWRLSASISSLYFHLVLRYFRVVPKRLRKLSVKDDKETKSRVFAILDYWSQSALWPLHRSLYKLLGRFPGDCTYDQTRLTSAFAKAFSGSTKYYSFDLSSATDRFPIDLQLRLLRLLTNKEVAEAWREIMVGEEYSYKGRPYKYNCGQPMGAHSSWAMFSLCHHMIVYIAGLRVGMKNRTIKRAYMLLGDDIVIHSDALAVSYREIIASLGVSISETKTHVSYNSFEFAKRWFYKGEEVSPFPIAGILETMKSWPLLVELLGREAPSRGYETLLDLSTRLWSITQIYPEERRGRQILKRIRIYLCLPMWHRDESSAVKGLKTLFRLVKSSMPCPPSEILRTATLAAQTVYRQEVGRGLKKIKELNTDLWQTVYSLDFSDPSQGSISDLTFDPKDVPMISVINRITERSQSISRSKEEPDWKYFWLEHWKSIDILLIPKFNGIIPIRTRDRKAGSQAHLALIAAKFMTSTTRDEIVAAWTREANPPRRRGRLARMKEQGIIDAN